jgi:tetratricopeptide (TPR) repeat protein
VTSLDGVAPDEAYSAAQNLAASGLYADAIVAYSAAISGDPDHITARVGRGLAFQRIGEHLKALADFGDVISSYADWPGAFVAYYSRAVSRQALGQTVEAIADCDEAIGRNPEHADALYLRGTARKALGQVEAAISDMDAVLRIDPSYHEAYLVRGGLHYLQQHWEQAVADFTAAIEHLPEGAPNVRECLYLRGMAAQQLGEHSAAIADFTRTIELAPGDGAAYLRRSRSYHEIGKPVLAATDLQVGMRMSRRES